MAIKLSDESTRALIDSTKHYFLTERDEQIGDLEASLFLDFVLEDAGPFFYNRAVQEMQTHLQATIANLDMTLYEQEPTRR